MIEFKNDTETESLNVTGRFTLTHIRNGEVLDVTQWENRIVTQGLTYIAKILAKQAPQNLYIGLYTGSYTPQASDTAATFPGSATEFTGYAESNRVLWNTAIPSTPTTTNAAARAEFNITVDAIINGAFMSTAPGKNAVTGELYCAKNTTAPKSVTVGDILLLQYETIVTNV